MNFILKRMQPLGDSVRHKTIMIEYNLGEMKSKDGSVLWYEVQNQASRHAIAISNLIANMPIFKELAKRLFSPRTLLYYQYIIKKEILPFVRQACVIRWYNLNGRQIPPDERKVVVPNSGIFPLLKECWEFQEVDIELANHLLFNLSKNLFSVAFLKGYAKKHLFRISKRLKKSKHHFPRAVERSDGWKLACHYAEGFDPSRRNDLNWFEGSEIDPSRVLIYFDSRNNSNGQLIKAETIRQIEKRGFKWVALKKDIMEEQVSYWQAEALESEKLLPKKLATTDLDRWILDIGNELLEQVDYWKQFYDAFDVKINYIPEEGFPKNIAQAIAFDVNEKEAGILVGKQRSEIYLPFTDLFVGFHPKHVFFTWNDRVEHYLKPNLEQIKVLVTVGYPNNVFVNKYENLKLCDRLKSKGANFIIALFDNAFCPDIRFSERAMADFYRLFFDWLLQDDSVGLILKSKKAFVTKNLYSIKGLIDKGLNTGRCINLDNVWGRFPADASMGADMAIGCGISSAVIESVIAGCRGIHYDNTYLTGHEFYKWGMGRIIFDDAEKMMVALKRYKQNPASEPKLGDWSEYLDKLDPFRDNRGGERMGTYMRWLLEAFDQGKNRDEAIELANARYAQNWGTDKIIKLESIL